MLGTSERRKELLKSILVFLLLILSVQGSLLASRSVASDPEIALERTETPSPPSPVETGEPLAEKGDKIDMLQMIKHGGIVGYIIILLSVVAIALVIEYAFTIRKSVLMPTKSIDQIRALIGKNRPHEILNHCGTTFIGKIVGAGMAEADLGYNAMVKAMEDSGDECTAQLTRKIEHLSIIGNIAPMLGLLGTVIGMLITFNRIFETSQVTGMVDPRQLAGGIFKALVTTVMGLIVAIPSLYAFALFRNRIDSICAEVMTVAAQLISPFKPAQKQGERPSENP
jgi:biopolymer transport protein ExbB